MSVAGYLATGRKRLPAGQAAWPDGGTYYVGLDLGQRKDHTALAVIDRRLWEGTERDPVTFAIERRYEHTLRMVKRLPLGTEYREIARRTRRLLETPPLAGSAVLVVDATGVGGPMMELLRAEIRNNDIVPVTITGGEEAHYAGSMWRVPKRDLIVGMQIMLEGGELKFAAGLSQGKTLYDEMRNMQVKVGLGGREVFEPLREGAHDDMVLAVSLAAWWSRRTRPSLTPQGRLPGM